jgi:hypothetical protein
MNAYEMPTSDDRLIWDTWLSIHYLPAVTVADELGDGPCTNRPGPSSWQTGWFDHRYTVAVLRMPRPWALAPHEGVYQPGDLTRLPLKDSPSTGDICWHRPATAPRLRDGCRASPARYWAGVRVTGSRGARSAGLGQRHDMERARRGGGDAVTPAAGCDRWHATATSRALRLLDVRAPAVAIALALQHLNALHDHGAANDAQVAVEASRRAA